MLQLQGNLNSLRQSCSRASMDHLVRGTQKPTRVLLLLLSVFIALSVFPIFVLDAANRLVYSVGAIATTFICLMLALFFGRPCLTGMVAIFTLLSSLLLMEAITAAMLVVYPPQLHFRLYGYATVALMWKLLPTITLGLPFLPAALYIVGTCSVEVAAIETSAFYDGDDVPKIMYTTSLAGAMVSLGMAWLKSDTFAKHFQVLQDLEVERALTESVVAAMCDAVLWLTPDGATILEADRQLKRMLGKNFEAGMATGSAFSEEQQQQVDECLGRSTPAVLPMTITNGEGSPVALQLLVVGHRGRRKNAERAVLLGLRLAAAAPAAPVSAAAVVALAPVTARPSSDVGSSEGTGSSGSTFTSSMPTTTATGQIFDRVDVDRWLADASEDRLVDLMNRLEQVRQLGRGERWLLDPEVLRVAADQVLGTGSYGVVCSGWLYGSPIAVKTAKHMRNSNIVHLVAIVNEIRILRHLRHPNVVLFHGACIDARNREVMLVMEKVQGLDLYKYVTKNSADSQAAHRFRLLVDVICALWYLHTQVPQIVHGDLKGSNILVEPALPRAKLVDFGISRLLTKYVQPLGGTLSWIAPEIICNPNTTPKASTDAFSFGRVAYLIIACQKPLQGVRRQTIIEQAQRGIMSPLTWALEKPLHAEAQVLCGRLLHPQPERRPNMELVHREVSVWRVPSPPNDPPPPDAAVVAEETRVAASPVPEAEAQTAPSAPASAVRHVSFAEEAAYSGHSGDLLPQGNPIIANKQPTPDFVEKLMVRTMLRKWNFPVAEDSCCDYHSALTELNRVNKILMNSECGAFKPYDNFQCGSCGVLDFRARKTCHVCNESAQGEASTAALKEEVQSKKAFVPARCSL